MSALLAAIRPLSRRVPRQHHETPAGKFGIGQTIPVVPVTPSRRSSPAEMAAGTTGTTECANHYVADAEAVPFTLES